MAAATFEIRGRGDQAPAEAVSLREGLPAIRALPLLQHILVGSELQDRRPTQILLGTLSTFGYRLVKPIPVRLDTEDCTVVASWQDADEFGTGASMSSACEDLGRTVAELYQSLKADQDRLGPDLTRIWHTLQEFVVETR